MDADTSEGAEFCIVTTALACGVPVSVPSVGVVVHWTVSPFENALPDNVSVVAVIVVPFTAQLKVWVTVSPSASVDPVGRQVTVESV